MLENFETHNFIWGFVIFFFWVICMSISLLSLLWMSILHPFFFFYVCPFRSLILESMHVQVNHVTSMIIVVLRMLISISVLLYYYHYNYSFVMHVHMVHLFLLCVCVCLYLFLLNACWCLPFIYLVFLFSHYGNMLYWDFGVKLVAHYLMLLSSHFIARIILISDNMESN